jgi:hypothetical protein
MCEAPALLLADGGTAALNPPEWIGTLRPRMVLLFPPPGEVPGAAVIQELAGYTLLRTGHNGWIELSTDGEQLWVERERW